MLLKLALVLLALTGSGLAKPSPQVRLHPDTGLNVFELIERYGYPLERHVDIQTADGFLLELHRIPSGKSHSLGPVLLMHGLLSSSADWVNNGANTSLAFRLADAGYDVWMGNARGNTYGKKHVGLDFRMDEVKFWNFSWHEIGKYDLPAYIDYILARTKSKNLFYVGHSQGTAAFWVMCSERPEYSEKIRLMSALGPAAYVKHMHNPFLPLVAQFEQSLEWISNKMGLHEFLPKSEFLEMLGKEICDDGSALQEMCANVIFLICGFDSQQFNATLLPVITSNAPAGASTKQLLHFLQLIKYGYFRQYDYHSEKANIEAYGQPTPPEYDLGKVTAPVALYYGQNDWLLSIEDVERLRDELPNVVLDNKIAYERFNHLDFIWSININENLYDLVLETMRGY